jgi:adenylate cyclase
VTRRRQRVDARGWLLGRPDDPPRKIARRMALLLIPTIIVANIGGAVVVFVLATWVIPSPHVDHPTTVLIVNLATAVGWLLLALAIGLVWGIRRYRASLRWLYEERPPRGKEQRQALRAPFGILRVHAALWGGAVIAFAALNLGWSLLLAWRTAIIVMLGGITTSAVVYLLNERIARGAAARALQAGVPEKPALPGITARSLLAWALGSGIPVLGLTLVALAHFIVAPVSSTQLVVTMLALGGVALTVGLLMTFFAARATADPVMSVRRALKRVEEGDLDVEVPVYDGSEVGLLQAGFNRMVEGLRERERVRDLFGRHVGEDVAREALERGIEMGGEVRDVAVLFVDVVGSTTIAATRPPTEVVELLNRFFAVVVEVVNENGGFINKFEGDAALAVFGAPVARGNPCAQALAAARAIMRRLREDVPDVDAGIGLSAGEAVAGNIGGAQRYEYTVIGDPVNAAARLTELSKDVPTRILASAEILERAGTEESRHWELGDAVTLRGRTEETRLASPVEAAVSGRTPGS